MKLTPAFRNETQRITPLFARTHSYQHTVHATIARNNITLVSVSQVGAAAHLETQLKNIDIYQKQLIKQHQVTGLRHPLHPQP